MSWSSQRTAFQARNPKHYILNEEKKRPSSIHHPPSLLIAVIATLQLTLPAADAPSQFNLLAIHTDEHNFRKLGCYRALLPPEQAFVQPRSLKKALSYQ